MGLIKHKLFWRFCTLFTVCVHFSLKWRNAVAYFVIFDVLPDICLKGQGLAGLFIAVPVTGTLVVKVLRMTEMTAFAKHAATSFMCLCRTWSICIKQVINPVKKQIYLL